MSPSSMTRGDAIHLAVAAPAETGVGGFAGRPDAVWTDEPARPLTLKISRAVFREPDAPWSRAHAAAMLNLSICDLSAQVLREGAALTNLVCEQRDAAFFDRFGVCLERLAIIGRAGIVSWSGVPSGINTLPIVSLAGR